MRTGKIIILLILLAFLNFQVTTTSAADSFPRNNHAKDLPLNYRFRPINFITYPLFTTPAIIFPGTTLNITTALDQNIQISDVFLKNAENTIDSSFSNDYDDTNQLMIIRFMVPNTVEIGLYSLFVETTLGNDYTWHSAKIVDSLDSQLSIVHVTDTHIGVADYSAVAPLNMVVREINLIRPQPAFVIHTGDLIDGGTTGNITQRYEQALTALANLSIPLFVVNGNHEIFANVSYWDAYLGAEYQHSVTYGPLHLALTSLKDQHGLTPSELAWIKTDIATYSDKTTLFAYHYDYNSQFEDVRADIHLLGHEHRSYVETQANYVRIATGNSWYQNDNELGEIRLLNFVDGRLDSYPIIEFGEHAPINPLPSIAPSPSGTTSTQTTSEGASAPGFEFILLLVTIGAIGHSRRKMQ
ncbi:MAG: metallophosphoesterase family protein [Candidatus Hodarchaeales archaeon]|jgi:predicted phosphodiesterase